MTRRLRRCGLRDSARIALPVRSPEGSALDYDPKNPFLLPGITVKTGKGDNFPVQQGQLQRWTKGRFVPFGSLWQSKRN